jgi:hypothetical protein
MPNGHGGAPFLAAPILFAVGAAAAALLRLGWASVGLCVLFAGLAGWRLAYHLHLRDADEYGGAYTSPDVHSRATQRYRIAAVIYGIIAAAGALGLLWWRGLP